MVGLSGALFKCWIDLVGLLIGGPLSCDIPIAGKMGCESFQFVTCSQSVIHFVIREAFGIMGEGDMPQGQQ
jgi:hypothetical protein